MDVLKISYYETSVLWYDIIVLTCCIILCDVSNISIFRHVARLCLSSSLHAYVERWSFHWLVACSSRMFCKSRERVDRLLFTRERWGPCCCYSGAYSVYNLLMFCLICGCFTSFAEGKVLFIFQITVSSSDVPLQLKHPGFPLHPAFALSTSTAQGQMLILRMDSYFPDLKCRTVLQTCRYRK